MTARQSPWAVFATVALGTFMATLDGSIVNVTLPTLAQTFGAAVTTIEWVSLSYLLTITGLLLPVGRLGDAYGRKRLFVWGMVVFTIGSALCGASVSLATLVAARIVQGIGAALLSANSVALVSQAFPPEKRGRALGLIGASVGLGLTVGPPLGGWILAAAGWRWVFYVNLPIGIVAVWLSLRNLPSGGAREGRRPSLDVAAALLQIVALIAITFGLSRGPRWGWTSRGVLGAFALGAACAALFAWRERRAVDPLLDFGMMRNRTFSAALASLFLSFVALFAVVFLGPFYLQRVAGLGPAAVGRVLVVIPLLLLAVSPASGALSDRFGSRALALCGLSITASGLALLAWLMGGALVHPLGVPAILGALAVIGLGLSLFQPPNSNAAMGAVPPQRFGVAGGLLATMRNLGMLFGIGMAAAIFEGREAVYQAAGRPSVAAAGLAMRDAFAAAALVLCVAIVWTASAGAPSPGTTPTP